MTTATARVLPAGDAGATQVAPTPIGQSLPAPAADLVSATPSPTVEALRAESRAALTCLVVLLRYPPEWADELERQAFAAGRVWSSKVQHGPLS